MKELFLVIVFLLSTLFVVFLIIAFGWFLVWTLLVRRFRFVRELFMIKDLPCNDSCHDPFRLQPSCKPGIKSDSKHSICNNNNNSNGISAESNEKSFNRTSNKKVNFRQEMKGKEEVEEKEEDNKENLMFIRERQLSSKSGSSSFQSNVKNGSMMITNRQPPPSPASSSSSSSTTKLHID